MGPKPGKTYELWFDWDFTYEWMVATDGSVYMRKYFNVDGDWDSSNWDELSAPPERMC